MRQILHKSAKLTEVCQRESQSWNLKLNWSRLAISMKDGGISSYTNAYKCFQALIKGLMDRDVS